GVNFTVIGTYKKNSKNGNAEEAQKEIYLTFASFGHAFNQGENGGWVGVTAKEGCYTTPVKEKVVGVVSENREIHPQDLRAIGHFDLYEEFSRVVSLFGAMRWIAYFVGILVLLSGVIGVSNIMLIVVKERTKEIGIRRALGEDPWSIR